MTTTKEIKNQIKSVNNIKQITRAMELMSVAKMRRAAERVEDTREYATRALEILKNVGQIPGLRDDLFRYPDTEKTLAVVLASDQSLCGSFNANVRKQTTEFIGSETAVDIVAVGTQTARFSERLRAEVIRSFSDFNERVQIADVAEMFAYLLDEFKAGNYRRVVVIYSHYETALKYTPLVRQLLPVDPENMGDMLDDSAAIRKEDMSSYLFEPSAESVLKALLPRLSRIRLFQAMMESQASEHAARMFAMKNATENAEEVANELETDYNRARQRQVTQEIAEISAGANALNT